MHEQPNSSDHARHDLLAVAALADRDATGEEAVRAQAQVDTCSECATLHAELQQPYDRNPPAPGDRATAGLPAAAGGCPAVAPQPDPSPVRSSGIVGDGFSRPLAVGLTTLGLAGLMLGILPGTLSFGGAASAPAGRRPDRPRSSRSSRHWALLRRRRLPQPKAARPLAQPGIEPTGRGHGLRQWRRHGRCTLAPAGGIGSTCATSRTVVRLVDIAGEAAVTDVNCGRFPRVHHSSLSSRGRC